MSGLRVYGVASGLDTENIIRQLMDAERIPLRKLQVRRNEMQLQRDAWRDINSRLRTLDSRAMELRLASTFTAMQATSSQSGVLTATANIGAQPASYDMVVEQLARTQRVASTRTADFTTPLTGRFAISGVTVSVTGAQTLADIQAAINGTAGIGVSANVVDGRLVLTRRETGAANPISYAFLDGHNILQGLGLFDSATGTVLHQELQAGRNAVVRVDGLRVERSGNVLNDVISGVEIVLRQESATPVRLEIARDSSRVLGAVRGFVDQYNSVMEFIAGKLGKGGDLQSEPTLVRVQAALRQLPSQKYGTVAGYTSLHDLGLTTRDGSSKLGFSQAGRLSLDETRLRERFSANPSAFREFFAGDRGFGQAVGNYLQTLIAAGQGAIPSRERGLEQTIQLLDGQVRRFNERLGQREEQLLRQFTALERALSGMQSQGEWLSGQLRTLGGFDTLLRG
jgi:flagellar hook-associated protein 2